MKIFCIHGNFQTAKVWQPLEERMKAGFSDLEMITEDLCAKQFQSFDNWTEDFCGRVKAQSNGEKSILLGYSLGGRLALHACLSRPDLWKSAIVVGADPGLESEEEKRLQLDKDRNWAGRLKSEPLEKLVDEWDEQSVFCGIENQAPRNIDGMDPDRLSQQFEVFSKGNQQNLAPKLAELTRPPILFLSGEKDKKYQKIAEDLASSCPLVKSGVVKDAGHRVPWENPNEFVQELGKFINNSKIC
jgi:2-succinyl-6-hydroxy-2,4-cyclohexadiene-1-carboxylate synthase